MGRNCYHFFQKSIRSHTCQSHAPLSLHSLSLSPLSLSLSLRQLGTRHIIEEMNTNRHTVQVIFICGGLRHNKTYVQATSDATGLCNIAAGNAAFEVGGLFFCALCYLLTPTALCREPYKSALGQKSSDLFSFTETISIVCTLKYGQFWFLVGHVFEKGSAPNVPRQLGWDLVGATIALTPKPCLAVDGVWSIVYPLVVPVSRQSWLPLKADPPQLVDDLFSMLIACSLTCVYTWMLCL